MAETIITAIISSICTGGLTWIFTIRYTRKQAEADAMTSMQGIYKEMIDDLQKDRKELKEERTRLKEKLKSLEEKYEQVDRAIKENSRVIEAMKPFLCGVVDCPNRKAFNLNTK